MRWDEIKGMPCSVARTLSVIGDRWTLLVLRDAFLRTRRFEDFQRQLGVTRHLLADRLRKLVAAGILEKVRYQEKPTRYEYRLTDEGARAAPGHRLDAALGRPLDGRRIRPAARADTQVLRARDAPDDGLPRMRRPGGAAGSRARRCTSELNAA